jgi:MmyB-like transcription regulator ligand binding domain
MHHPVVGDLELTGEALDLPGDTGITIITYTVEPHTPSEQALGFLASWASEQTAKTPAEETN